MKVSVDFSRCIAVGCCARSAPTVFAVGADGSLRVLQEEPTEQLREAVLEAEEACPTGAITVTP